MNYPGIMKGMEKSWTSNFFTLSVIMVFNGKTLIRTGNLINRPE